VQQLVAEVLSAWRRTERLAEELDPDDPVHDTLSEAAVRPHGIYLDLTDPASKRESATAVAALPGGERPG
jgi:acetoin utilization deacetylase AcuC-like enzyme